MIFQYYAGFETAPPGGTDSQIPAAFILSGAQDPVGEFGRGVRRVFRRYKKIGMTDAEMILYPDDRHEILNETDKENVWHDILSWITYHEL